MPANLPLTTGERLARCQRLCVHFARNVAYFRAARDAKSTRITPKTKYWSVSDSDHFDMAVIEWCKVFGDPLNNIKSRHGWEYVVGRVMNESAEQFRIDMLADIGVSDNEFEAQRKAIKVYRDKFVAHLDEEREGHFPSFDIALKATVFLVAYIRKWAEQHGHNVSDPNHTLLDEYNECFAEASSIYAKL